MPGSVGSRTPSASRSKNLVPSAAQVRRSIGREATMSCICDVYAVEERECIQIEPNAKHPPWNTGPSNASRSSAASPNWTPGIPAPTCPPGPPAQKTRGGWFATAPPLNAPCACTSAFTLANGTTVPVCAQPVAASVFVVRHCRRNTAAVLEISYDTSMSPSRRHGIFAPAGLVQSWPSWLSSNVRNVSPVGAARVNARYRNVLPPTGWSTAAHASRMLDLAGLTPPASVVKRHAAGFPSSVPPWNEVSCPLGSSLCPTRPVLCSASQSLNGPSLT